MSCIVGELQNGRVLNVKINISNQIIDFVNEKLTCFRDFFANFGKFNF